MESKRARVRTTGAIEPVAPEAFTVSEFCKAHRISRALFYILLRNGRGPRVMRAGRRTLVSANAADAWRRGLEAASAGGPK
jgi:hypothetical protein